MVTAAKIVGEYVVELTFDSGERRRIDLYPALTGPVFEPVRDPAYFAKMTVDAEAGTIVWPNGAISHPSTCTSTARRRSGRIQTSGAASVVAVWRTRRGARVVLSCRACGPG